MAIRTEDARYEQPKIQFYGISFLRPYKQSGRWQDVLDTAIDQTAYIDA